VLTKEQAEVTADGLLSTAVREREVHAARSTRSLVWLFPSLGDVTASKRHGMLGDARAYASKDRLLLLLSVLTGVAFLAFMLLDARGNSGSSRVAGWCAALLFIANQVHSQFLIRSYLRRATQADGQ
jgi:hypothetical protein